MCVSARESCFDADTLLECVVRVNGANTVRCCFVCACCFRANGLVGDGGSCWNLGAFVEKGSKLERSDEIGALVGGAVDF